MSTPRLAGTCRCHPDRNSQSQASRYELPIVPESSLGGTAFPLTPADFIRYLTGSPSAPCQCIWCHSTCCWLTSLGGTNSCSMPSTQTRNEALLHTQWGQDCWQAVGGQGRAQPEKGAESACLKSVTSSQGLENAGLGEMTSKPFPGSGVLEPQSDG